MLSTTSNIVQGSVRFYNAEKNFGFVEVSGQRVFFHLSACREVDGTPEEPVFSERHSDKAPTWWKGMRYPETIILRVVAGPKGPMAAVWGYRPKRNWLQTLQHQAALASYADGHVQISWSRREYGPAHRELIGRFTAAPILEQTGDPDEDPWRLTLEFDAYDGPYRQYSAPSGMVQQTFNLVRWGDSAKRSEHGGGITLTLHDVDRKEWVTIRFSSGRWYGWEPGKD
jgi:hypothetical protein